MLTLYTSLLITHSCFNLFEQSLSPLAFPCTPVEGQDRLVQPSKGLKIPQQHSRTDKKAGGLKTLI